MPSWSSDIKYMKCFTIFTRAIKTFIYLENYHLRIKPVQHSHQQEEMTILCGILLSLSQQKMEHFQQTRLFSHVRRHVE